MKLSKKHIKIRMTKTELDVYYNWTRKSAHVFKNKKLYTRKRQAKREEL